TPGRTGAPRHSPGPRTRTSASRTAAAPGTTRAGPRGHGLGHRRVRRHRTDLRRRRTALPGALPGPDSVARPGRAPRTRRGQGPGTSEEAVMDRAGPVRPAGPGSAGVRSGVPRPQRPGLEERPRFLGTPSAEPVLPQLAAKGAAGH